MASALRLGGETSRRRMADTSDTSFSFQIPTSGLEDEYLLEYDDTFLQGAHDAFATPAPPSRFTLEPLTINDLTPGPSKPAKSTSKQIPIRSTLAGAGETPRRRSSRIQQRPKPSAATRLREDISVPQSPRGERIDSLKAQLDSLADELGGVQEAVEPDSPGSAAPLEQNLPRREAPPARQRDPAKPAVREGGIAKVRPQRGVRRTSGARNAAAAVPPGLESDRPLPAPTTSPTEPPALSRPIKSESSVDAASAVNVADVLMTPKHDLVTSTHVTLHAGSSKSTTELSKPTLSDLPPGTANANALIVEPSDAPVAPRDSHMTISQLSPLDPRPHSLSGGADEEIPVESAVEEAPLRISSKRPVSVEQAEEIEGGRARKKGKANPGVGASGASSSSSAPSSSKHAVAAPFAKRLPPTTRKSIRRLSASGRGSRLAVVGGRKSSGRSGATLRAGRGSTGSSTSGNRRAKKEAERESGPHATSSGGDKKEDGDTTLASSSSNHLQNCKESSVEPHLKQNLNRDRWEPHVPAPEQRQGPAAARSTSNARSGSSSKVKMVHATVPVGFNFRVSARLEARKSVGAGRGLGGSEGARARVTAKLVAAKAAKAKGKEKEKEKPALRRNDDLRTSKRARHQAPASNSNSSSTLAAAHPMPDFKALHASHEADLTRRKEKLLRQSKANAVIPVSPRFETKNRLKERHKFDDMVKEKELRLQEEREAQRRVQAEEEERLVRELRRKAIPKAHEVPEWYKDAPKRGK